MNTEISSNPTPQKDNRTIIYGVLIAALLGTWGYIIYDKSKTTDKIENPYQPEYGSNQ
jgi:hypothetical protein